MATSYPNSSDEIESVSSSAPIDLIENEPNVSGSISENETTVANKRGRSVVWNHFEKETIDGRKRAICKYCKKSLSGDPKNETSHLREHSERCFKRPRHGGLTQTFITNLAKKTSTSTSNFFDQELTRKELAKMIVMHEYPLSIVEHVGFQNYSKALQPLFKMVSRNTIKVDIMNLYNKEKEYVMKLIEKNEGRIAITTDMWTTSNQRRGYMAITGHFIDGSWRLHSHILRFASVPCPHTKEVLCENIIECLSEWHLTKKISTITLDNCSTNDAMVDGLLDRLDPEFLILSGTMLHMRCCAHILNLIVKDGMDVVKHSIEKIRDCVAYWTATPKREEKFVDAIYNSHVESSKKLELDCPTRWNSTFKMLDVALMYKDVFARLKSQYENLPSEEDWKFAKDMVTRLQVFYDITELFSGAKYPTANLFFPSICQIRLALRQWLTDDDVMIQIMAQKMLAKFDKYWMVINGTMAVASVLDPRFKMMLIEFYFPKLFEHRPDDEIARIYKLCADLVQEYQGKYNFNVKKDGTTGNSSSNLTQAKGKDALFEFDLFVSMKRSTYVRVKSELDEYLEDCLLPRSQDFDILRWWEVNGVKYPTLQAIARDIYAIPVSTVAFESAFSAGSKVISSHRSRLHAKTVEALMCTRSWLWALEVNGERRVDGVDLNLTTAFEDLDVD